VVGSIAGIFVGVIVCKLAGADVAIETGVPTEAVTSAWTEVLVPVNLMVRLPGTRVAVDSGWTVSIELTLAVKDGAGMAGKPYWLAAFSPKVAR
jgi:hypothetical protein